MSEPYKRPPIIEAVIEFRCGERIPSSIVDKVRVRLKQDFPREEELKNYSVKLDFDAGSASVDTESVGYKMTSRDGVDVRVVNTNSFTISRLAPYLGWDEYFAQVQPAFGMWKRIALGQKAISRVGLRYVNRIDVPYTSTGEINLNDYFNLQIAVPQPPLKPLHGFVCQFTSALGKGPEACGVTLNYSGVPSPLVAHSSYVVDIDVYRDGDVPRAEEALWQLIGKMRDHKNAVFEAIVTDRSRELFR